MENVTLHRVTVGGESGGDEAMLLANNDTFQLRSLNVVIKRGNIIGICGAVGSGNNIFKPYIH